MSVYAQRLTVQVSFLKELTMNDETSQLFNATLQCWYFFLLICGSRVFQDLYASDSVVVTGLLPTRADSLSYLFLKLYCIRQKSEWKRYCWHNLLKVLYSVNLLSWLCSSFKFGIKWLLLSWEPWLFPAFMPHSAAGHELCF